MPPRDSLPDQSDSERRMFASYADPAWCAREMRPADLDHTQALYTAAMHAGPGLVADAVRYVYEKRPCYFARFPEDFHRLMRGDGIALDEMGRDDR